MVENITTTGMSCNVYLVWFLSSPSNLWPPGTPCNTFGCYKSNKEHNFGRNDDIQCLQDSCNYQKIQYCKHRLLFYSTKHRWCLFEYIWSSWCSIDRVWWSGVPCHFSHWRPCLVLCLPLMALSAWTCPVPYTPPLPHNLLRRISEE